MPNIRRRHLVKISTTTATRAALVDLNTSRQRPHQQRRHIRAAAARVPAAIRETRFRDIICTIISSKTTSQTEANLRWMILRKIERFSFYAVTLLSSFASFPLLVSNIFFLTQPFPLLFCLFRLSPLFRSLFLLDFQYSKMENNKKTNEVIPRFPRNKPCPNVQCANFFPIFISINI